MTTDTLEQSINTALSAWEDWNAVPLAERLARLKPLARQLQAPQVTWLLDQIAMQMGNAPTLPGPTGEANSLQWHGRGLVAIVHDESASQARVLNPLFCALATGNAVIIQRTPLTEPALTVMHQDEQLAALVTGVADEQPALLAHPGIALYALSTAANQADKISHQLSLREGALAQLVVDNTAEPFASQYTQDYPWRFITERTLTINTTAVGGNASLLELGGKSGG